MHLETLDELLKESFVFKMDINSVNVCLPPIKNFLCLNRNEHHAIELILKNTYPFSLIHNLSETQLKKLLKNMDKNLSNKYI